MVVEDFDQCGAINAPDEGASRFDYTVKVAGIWFILNSTGLGWINKGGYTHFGLRSAHDLSNTTPPHADGEDTYIDVDSAEFATDYNWPWFGHIRPEL